MLRAVCAASIINQEGEPIAEGSSGDIMTNTMQAEDDIDVPQTLLTSKSPEQRRHAAHVVCAKLWRRPRLQAIGMQPACQARKYISA
jgi:hypothetical protein